MRGGGGTGAAVWCARREHLRRVRLPPHRRAAQVAARVLRAGVGAQQLYDLVEHVAGAGVPQRPGAGFASRNERTRTNESITCYCLLYIATSLPMDVCGRNGPGETPPACVPHGRPTLVVRRGSSSEHRKSLRKSTGSSFDGTARWEIEAERSSRIAGSRSLRAATASDAAARASLATGRPIVAIRSSTDAARTSSVPAGSPSVRVGGSSVATGRSFVGTGGSSLATGRPSVDAGRSIVEAGRATESTGRPLVPTGGTYVVTGSSSVLPDRSEVAVVSTTLESGSSVIGTGRPSLATGGKELNTLRLRLGVVGGGLSPRSSIPPSCLITPRTPCRLPPASRSPQP